MKLHFTLSLYIVRKFIASAAIVFFTFAVLILLVDALELIRRSHNKDIPFWILIEMIILKFQFMGQRIIPFVMLIGGVMSYTKLTRTNELVAIRSAGISVWQFLFPTITTAFAIGIVVVTIVNPLSCIMLSKYEHLESKYLHGRDSLLAISKNGVWLRQKIDDSGEIIIHAREATGEDNIELYDVIVFIFESNFVRRIDAENAKLVNGFWNLENAIITNTKGITDRHKEYFLKTDMTVEEIHNSFASPETISFWELPRFIDTLEKSGFSALSHRLHWNKVLVSPLFYVSMIFIAALFSLTPVRHGKTGLLITGSIIAGFFIYFFTNLIGSLGLSGTLPIVLAAWVPVIVSLLTGIGFLLHFEDG